LYNNIVDDVSLINEALSNLGSGSISDFEGTVNNLLNIFTKLVDAMGDREAAKELSDQLSLVRTKVDAVKTSSELSSKIFGENELAIKGVSDITKYLVGDFSSLVRETNNSTNSIVSATNSVLGLSSSFSDISDSISKATDRMRSLRETMSQPLSLEIDTTGADMEVQAFLNRVPSQLHTEWIVTKKVVEA